MTGLEQAMALDRQYFDEHPDEPSYVRELIPGEFDQAPSWAHHDVAVATHVAVTQIGDGIRQREPFTLTVIEP